MERKGNANKQEAEIIEINTAPLVGLAAVEARLEDVKALYQRVLREGEDYGIPEGMRIKKPFLFLAGVEKCLRLHNLTPKFDLIFAERDWQTPRFYFEVSCSLLNKDGVTESYGTAVAHTDESGYHPTSYSRMSREQLVFNGINRCRKMADIRSLRSAVKLYGMLSHIFAIDEDTFDSGQAYQDNGFDPYTRRIDNTESVAWLERATGMPRRAMASKLGITRWGDWNGTVLEAFAALIVQQTVDNKRDPIVEAEVVAETPLANPENVAALKARLGGISEELLLDFLGVSDFSEYRGSVEDAIRRVQDEEIARQEVDNPLDRIPE